MVVHNSEIKRNYTIEDLEELLDNIPYDVWIKDKDGKHVYINKSCAEKIGHSKEDIIGKSDFELRPYEMAKHCAESDNKVLNKEYSVSMQECCYINGEEKSYEVCKVKLRDNEKESSLIGGIAKEIAVNKVLKNNITENRVLKEIENNNLYHEFNSKLMQRQSIQKDMKMILDTGIDIYGIIKNENKILKWVEVNNNLKNTLGWSLEEYCRIPMIDFIHSKDKIKFFRSIIKTKRNGEYRNFICLIKCKSGEYKRFALSWKTIDSEGSYILMARDLTSLTIALERKKIMKLI